jgi:hypothetical protein
MTTQGMTLAPKISPFLQEGLNALGGLGWLGWSLRYLRRDEAMDRQWTLQHARWRAEDRAWREQ